MQSALSRSYKRWQNGESYEKAKEVMKHFFPSGKTSSGLNRRERVQHVAIGDAVTKVISAKKSEDDQRSVMLALKCHLPKEQYKYFAPNRHFK